MSNSHDALEEVRAQIRAAELEFGRDPGSVQLIAVSKTKPTEQIRAVYDAGQRDFGENYLDEALGKIDALGDTASIWHFIGHIQSNKTRPIASHFAWAHCIDREKIARRLSDQRPDGMQPLNICIQVNIDGEDTKAGVSPEEVCPLAESIMSLPKVRLRGLMVIPAPREGFEAQREPLARTRELYQQLQADHPGLDTLSMGMSGDMRAAIAEGATMVRIGTAVFGARPPK
ncbi:MAG: YggS family pyridoxal phosphate-dependent enzyme [Pseudomonadota bacterium]